MMVGIASAAIYSVLSPISEDTGLTLSDLNAGTGYMFLFFVRIFSLVFCDEANGVSGMGLSILASACITIWQATCISILHVSNSGK